MPARRVWRVCAGIEIFSAFVLKRNAKGAFGLSACA